MRFRYTRFVFDMVSHSLLFTWQVIEANRMLLLRHYETSVL